MATNDPAVIDLAILAGVIGDDPAKLDKFAHKFVDSTRAALAELEACLAGGDVARMRELGHRVKSAARIVGALGMGELCERLEKLPPAELHNELAAARALVNAMSALLERIAAALAASFSSSS